MPLNESHAIDTVAPTLCTGLDDLSFDDLVHEALALLPVYAPEWTNHNPSDPGITLVELLAYFSEILMYRLGRISRNSKLQFLRLLAGEAAYDSHDWQRLAHGEAQELQGAIEGAVRELAHVDCAVTPQDFERLALQAVHAGTVPGDAVRILCVPHRDLENSGGFMDGESAPNHVSLIVAPHREVSVQEQTNLIAAVWEFLTPRCLLTTRLHVIGPVYLHIAMGVTIVPRPGQPHEDLMREIEITVPRHFGSGTETVPQGAGWTFGKPLHVAEAMGIIDRIAGVDYVENVTIFQLATDAKRLQAAPSSVGVQIGVHSQLGIDAWLGGSREIGVDRLVRGPSGGLDAVMLKPWELLRVTVSRVDISEPGAGLARGGRR